MKPHVPSRRAEEFPYVVTASAGRFSRERLDLYDATSPDAVEDGYDPIAIGFSGRGSPSPGARRALQLYFSRRAARVGSAYSLVFSPNDCVHLLPDGTTVEGRSTPAADTLDVREYDRIDYPLVDLRHVPLPAHSKADHLCVRTLCADRFEISSGASCILALLDEPDDEGTTLTARFTDAAGRFSPPPRFRGAKVTGVRDGVALLGPVQPDGVSRVVVGPWPADVKAACVEVAGDSLPAAVFDAVWRIIDPVSRGFNWVGVLEAA